MRPVFKKLNYKNQKTILVIDCPNSFEEELLAMKNEAKIIKNSHEVKEIDFAIKFVKTQSQDEKAIL
jgi:hypothetical protein